jgi:hypothetical protein
MMVGRRLFALAVSVAAACGDSDPSPQVVVENAGSSPVVIGATPDSVLWTTGSTVHGASVTSLPASGQELATASGPIAAAGNYAVYFADGKVWRVSLAGAPERLFGTAADTLGGSSEAPPRVALTSGGVVSWGVDNLEMMATLNRIDRCDHVRVAAGSIYVAGDASTDRRLLRIDQTSGTVTSLTGSSAWATMFPSGGTAGATYRGRIVNADETGALWLVEEMPTGRGIVVAEPLQGEASVVLPHLSHATGFFASADALYWQEGDELLTAPRAGGAASIITSLPGPAGALADGYVYYVNGSAIERLAVD